MATGPRGIAKEKRYASFIALDWKNHRIIEWSCSPTALSSYFEESALPFQVTPAFFRSEVLLRYKQNPDKYILDQRNVQCRGTWSLRYDVNERNQVHAYLCDLANLPYEEQLYWRSFNEPPKDGISSRAYKTDFLAEWDSDYEPLSSLKQILSSFPAATHLGQPQPIWRCPGGSDPFSSLTGVVTDSSKEWEDQVLTLAKILIDNLSEKNLRKVAGKLNCDDPALGSLKLLGRCLAARGFSGTTISEIVSPLEEVWALRSRGIAHSGTAALSVDRRALFRRLLEDCDTAMRSLSQLVESGVFDI